MGNTFETYQVASSARERLDQLGLYDTKVTLMTTEESQVRLDLGKPVEKYVEQLLRKQRISYLPNVQIAKLEGENELEKIYFHKEGDYSDDAVPDTEYFLETDMVICENGIGRPT